MNVFKQVVSLFLIFTGVGLYVGAMTVAFAVFLMILCAVTISVLWYHQED